MSRRPGVPSLLRQINDRSAFELLLTDGPLTRARLGELTGLSKVTASQMVARLQERGLVEVVGARSAGRGPSAELYAVRPGASHGIGVEMRPDAVHAELADLTGAVVGRLSREVDAGNEPVALVAALVRDLVAGAGVDFDSVNDVVIGVPGVVDPAAGDIRVSFDLTEWHPGLRAAVTEHLGRDVRFENDVNLAATAERAEGAGRDVDDMVLLWAGRGIGMAVVIGGRPYRGATGAAGEVGYLPVPGTADRATITRPAAGAFQGLVGEAAVSELAASHGFARDTAAASVRAAIEAGPDGAAFLGEFADRLAVGLAAVCTVVDPAVVVLSGDVGSVADDHLCGLIAAAIRRIAPVSPRIVPTAVPERAVLRGAVLAAVDHARAALF